MTRPGVPERGGYGRDLDSCPGCRARSAFILEATEESCRKGREEAQDAEIWELIEWTLASVGLGRDMGIPLDLDD